MNRANNSILNNRYNFGSIGGIVQANRSDIAMDDNKFVPIASAQLSAFNKYKTTVQQI